MSRTPKPTCSWDPLQKRLGGSFTASARGLLAPVLELFCPDGEGLGRLSLGAAPGTRLWFTDRTAALEVSGRRLHLVSDGKELLAASPKRDAPWTGSRSPATDALI